LTAACEFSRSAPDEAGIAFVLQERGAAFRFPAACLQCQEDLGCRGDRLRRPRHVEAHCAVLAQPVALAAQFLLLLGGKRVLQHIVGIASCVEAGAMMRLQDL
jgi:hypothetical protein